MKSSIAQNSGNENSQCHHESLDPNPQDCSTFLQCVHGTYVTMNCPSGLKWNNRGKICDWPENSDCNSTSNGNTSHEVINTNQENLNGENSENEKCEHESLDPNPDDCSSFLQCVHGNYVTMNCPSGLEWNNRDKICDWPENSDCSGNTIPA